jgi:hypothetical protein
MKNNKIPENKKTFTDELIQNSFDWKSLARYYLSPKDVFFYVTPAFREITIEEIEQSLEKLKLGFKKDKEGIKYYEMPKILSYSVPDHLYKAWNYEKVFIESEYIYIPGEQLKATKIQTEINKTKIVEINDWYGVNTYFVAYKNPVLVVKLKVIELVYNMRAWNAGFDYYPTKWYLDQIILNEFLIDGVNYTHRYHCELMNELINSARRSNLKSKVWEKENSKLIIENSKLRKGVDRLELED